jgi:hypothetical protein
MDIGKVRRVVKVEPEPFPLGNPNQAPKEPRPAPAETPDKELVPA